MTEKTKPIISMDVPTIEALEEAGEDCRWGSPFYCDPDKMNLEIVEEIDCGGGWDFDKVVVWKNNHNNELRWGWDSGCSCPSPFETTTSWNELDRLPDTMELLRTHVLGSEYRNFGAEGLDFIRKVEKLLNS